jgi:uncharacterized protein YndB with AHSA1/START domain
VSKRLATGVDIDATADRVWRVLTDVSAYDRWNPFIVHADGTAEAGARSRCECSQWVDAR